MKHVLVLGAAGSLARVTTQYLRENNDVELTLYLRNSFRLATTASSGIKIIEGDVLDTEKLIDAMQGIDIVYANLSGEMKEQAQSIIEAMREANVGRLIFISSMGIYDEVPGERYGSILDPYRESASLIEASELDYTIIRPAWFSGSRSLDYQITNKGESFKGENVSRLSIADFISTIISNPKLFSRESIGISQV